MNNLLKVIVLFFAVAIYFSLGNSLSYAAIDISTKQLQPIIIIPKDQKLHSVYESSLNQSAQRVREWYADQLGGNYIQLNPVKLVYSNKSLKDFRCGSGRNCPDNDYSQVWGVAWDEVYQNKNGLITQVWVIGAGGWAGGAGIPEQGFTVMGDWSLDAIAELYPKGPTGRTCGLIGDGSCTRDAQTGAMAHELGHALGLDYWSKDWHTIGDDGQYSIMSNWWFFPNLELVDTPTNPERSHFKIGMRPIKRITKNNPAGNPYLLPINSPNTSFQPASTTVSITPTPAYQGDSIEIKGSGFGKDRATLEFYNSFLKKSWVANVISWSDTSIKVQLPSDIAVGTYDVLLGGNDQVGQRKHVTYLYINQKRPTSAVINFSATCGQDQKPVSSIHFKLHHIQSATDLGFFATNDEGKAIIKMGEIIRSHNSGVFTIESPVLKEYGSFSQPQSHSFNASDYNTFGSSFGSYVFKFNYPICPGEVQVGPTPAPVVVNEESDNIDPDKVETIIVSTDEDFSGGIPTETTPSTLVIDNPEDIDEVTFFPTTTVAGAYYIRQIEADGDVKDYIAENVNDGDTIQVGNIEVKIERVITRIDMVNSRDGNPIILWDTNLGILEPDITVFEGENQFIIRRYYSDDPEFANPEAVSGFSVYGEVEQEIPKQVRDDNVGSVDNGDGTYTENGLQYSFSDHNRVEAKCENDSNLGRDVYVQIQNGYSTNHFDCQVQDQRCEEFLNNDYHDARCVE